QMDTSVNAANQVVSVGADIAFDADPKFFACLVRFESSSVPSTLPTDYDVYPLYGRLYGGYFFVIICVSYVVLLCTKGFHLYFYFLPTTLTHVYDVLSLNVRHYVVYYTVKDCVTIDVLPRTPGNNVYVGFMVWSNFTATKCRGLVSLNQVIKEIICLQPLK